MGPPGKCPKNVKWTDLKCPILKPRSSIWDSFRSNLRNLDILREVIMASWPSTVMGRAQCNRGFPGYLGKCQKNVKRLIWEGRRKMSNTIEIKCQMGSRGLDFWTPRKMFKKCQMDISGGSQMDPLENVQKMSNGHFGGSPRGPPENVKQILSCFNSGWLHIGMRW